MATPSCPRCGGALSASDVGDGVGACRCGCFVVDGAARRRLTTWLRLDEGLYQQLVREGARGPACCFCSEQLRTFSLKGVVVDGCPGCHALLLDRGELTRLTGRPEPAPPTTTTRQTTTTTMAPATLATEEPEALAGRTFLDARFALEQFLGTAPWVQVKQERQLAEALLSIELSNRYALHTPGGVGHIVREHNGVAEQIVQLFTGGLLRSTYVVTDARSNPTLQLHRGFAKLVMSRLEVCLYEGARLGSVERTFSVLSSTYELKDENGRTFATLKRPLTSLWQFHLLGVDGEDRGRIAKEWSGFGSEYFTDGDDFGVDFGHMLPGRPWTVAERAVITGAALAIDLDHFERKGRGNDSLFDVLR